MQGASGLAASDRAYMVQVVAVHTGMSQADAEKRVSDVTDQMTAAEAVALAERETLSFANGDFDISWGSRTIHC